MTLNAGDILSIIDPQSLVSDPDSDLASFQYEWFGADIAGLTINSQGQLQGQPTEPGTHQISLRVTDPVTGQTGERVFALTVNPVDTSPPAPPPLPAVDANIVGTPATDFFTDQSGSQHYDGSDGWDRLDLPGYEADYSFATQSDGTGLIFHTNGDVDRVTNVEALYFSAEASQRGNFAFFGLSAGTAGDDTVVGSDASETLFGDAGNDMLYGAGGNDRIDGGDGWDRVNLDGVQSDYTFVLHTFQNGSSNPPPANGIVVATSSVTGQITALDSIEQVYFMGDDQNSLMADVITSTVTDPIPEFLNHPSAQGVAEGGFKYPIVIDLGGNGADLVGIGESRIVFESEAGGPLMRVGWVSPKDAMLVLDRDGDGIINKLSEMSFVNDFPGARTDLEGLRGFDTNKDSVFDRQDEAWSLFQVWRDVNQNGVGIGRELATLDEMGIAGISLEPTVLRESTDGYVDSIVLNEATLLMEDGSTRTAYDTALRAELAHIYGPAMAPSPLNWLTYSWTADGAFGVAHVATGHSGQEDDLAVLQSIDGTGLDPAADIPDQNLVRYMDSDDSLAAPPEFVFDPSDPLIPAFGIKPLVFDLDGNGLNLLDPAVSPISIDANQDGFADTVGWVGNGDGLLALDKDGNGTIDVFSDISFVEDLEGAQTDLEGLRAYDTNQNGWLDAGDAEFGRFQIWKDINYSATVEDGELSSLEQIGIRRIHLTSRPDTGYQHTRLSNRVFGLADFEWADGTVGSLGDVELRAYAGSAPDPGSFDHAIGQVVSAENPVAPWAMDRQARYRAMLDLAGNGVQHGGQSELVAGGAVSWPGAATDFRADGLVANVSAQEPAMAGGDKRTPSWSMQLVEPNEFVSTPARDFERASERPERRSHDLGLRTSVEPNRWWAIDIDRSGVWSGFGGVQTLADRLRDLDSDKEGGQQTAAQSLPNEDAQSLAERQRFLQAIAAFRGSSGVAAMRRFEIDRMEETELAKPNGSVRGFGGRSTLA